MYIVTNFNHERFLIAASAARASRLAYSESFNHAMSRETFGKPLIKHQVIRYHFEIIRKNETSRNGSANRNASRPGGKSCFHVPRKCKWYSTGLILLSFESERHKSKNIKWRLWSFVPERPARFSEEAPSSKRGKAKL